MARRALDDDPSLENEFALAAHLHMTVGRLRHEIDTYGGPWEIVYWGAYLRKQAQEQELAQITAKWNL